jgi:hypothetical protein
MGEVRDVEKHYDGSVKIRIEYLSDDMCLKVSNSPIWRFIKLDSLRLAPADQQPWMVYEDGVTVIPEWAECTYLIPFSEEFRKIRYWSSTKKEFSRSDASAVYYKLGNVKGLFKDGWTDNPNEVSE